MIKKFGKKFAGIGGLADKFNKLYERINEKAAPLKARMDADVKFKNRFIIMSLSILFIADYVMFSYLTDKNIFNIFPAIPAISDQKEISVFLPSLETTELIKETRMAPQFSDKERFVNYLFKTVSRGSIYENTSVLIPSEMLIKKIWIYGDDESICAIDIETKIVDQEVKIVAGSEDKFKKALDTTIKENIKSIKKVMILNSGVYNKPLWEEI